MIDGHSGTKHFADVQCGLWVCLMSFFMGALSAQTVNRLDVEAFAEELEVSYSLKADRPVSVQLYFSEDDGLNWVGPLESVTGDVGENVGAGRNKIVWNFAREVEQLWGEQYRFKVRTSEHYSFSMKFREEWFNMPTVLKRDFMADEDLVAFRLRQVDGWNSMELKAPSGNYDFEMHHELKGGDVQSRVELLGYRHRSTGVGMLCSALLPGSGISYVTFQESQNWSVDVYDRKSKQGNGNFWGIAIFGGAAVLLHNVQQQAIADELRRPGGTPASAAEAGEAYDVPKWGMAGLAGFIYTMQIARVGKWNKAHKSDMAKFMSEWE
jgi:hypothetical protein